MHAEKKPSMPENVSFGSSAILYQKIRSFPPPSHERFGVIGKSYDVSRERKGDPYGYSIAEIAGGVKDRPRYHEGTELHYRSKRKATLIIKSLLADIESESEHDALLHPASTSAPCERKAVHRQASAVPTKALRSKYFLFVLSGPGSGNRR